MINSLQDGCFTAAIKQTGPKYRSRAKACQLAKDMSVTAMLRPLPEVPEQIDHFSSAICRIISNYESRKAYPQKGTGCPLSTCGAGSGEKCELSTGQPCTEPHRDRRLIAGD